MPTVFGETPPSLLRRWSLKLVEITTWWLHSTNIGTDLHTQQKGLNTGVVCFWGPCIVWPTSGFWELVQNYSTGLMNILLSAWISKSLHLLDNQKGSLCKLCNFCCSPVSPHPLCRILGNRNVASFTSGCKHTPHFDPSFLEFLHCLPWIPSATSAKWICNCVLTEINFRW